MQEFVAGRVIPRRCPSITHGAAGLPGVSETANFRLGGGYQAERARVRLGSHRRFAGRGALLGTICEEAIRLLLNAERLLTAVLERAQLDRHANDRGLLRNQDDDRQHRREAELKPAIHAIGSTVLAGITTCRLFLARNRATLSQKSAATG